MPEQPLEARPAGSRRFWWTVLAFAAVNAGALLAVLAPKLSLPKSAAAAAGMPPPLEVKRFGPGEGGLINARSPLTWAFDADVASRPGPIDDAPGTLAPAVPGKWRWADARTLEFAPDADYPRAANVTVTLAPQRLRTPGGRALAAPVTSTVHTRPLELTAARQVGRLDGDPIVELTFNDPVDAEAVLAHVAVADRDGPQRTVALHGRGTAKTVRLRCGLPDGDAAPPGDLVLYVTLKKGLTGTAGPLGFAADLTAPVGVPATLAATEVHAHANAGDDPSVVVRFNQPVDLERLRAVLSVEPAVPFTLSRDADQTARLTGAFVPGSPYTVRIAKPPAGTTDGFPRPTTLGVFVPDRPSSAWLEHNEGYLGARGNRTIMARAVNVPAVRVSVSRVYDHNLVGWRNATAGAGRRYRHSGNDDTARFARPIATKRIELTGGRNAVQEVRLALDELLPNGTGGDGVYRVGLTAEGANAANLPVDDDGEAYDLGSGSTSAVVTLSDVGLSAKQGRDGVIAWAVSLSTGKPIAGARLRLFSDKGALLSESPTDADGLATLKNVRPAPGEASAVLLADLGETDGNAAPAGLTWLDLRSSRTSFAGVDVNGRAYLRDGYEAFVYADRGVYRPGETANLRAIVRGRGDAVPPPFPLKWQLRRPDLRDWKSQVTELDADGAAGLTLSFPTDLPTGRWTARVGLSGPAGKGLDVVFGTVEFQVEDFIPERIKAKVDVTADKKGAARLSFAEKASIDLQADYLFGRPAAGLMTTASLSIAPATFAAKNYAGWTFGDAGGIDEAFERPRGVARQFDLEPAATTDDAGRATWRFDPGVVVVAATKPPSKGGYKGPWRLTVSAGVLEQGGRAAMAGTAFDVDALDRYVGLRAADPSPKAREPALFAVALVARDGSAAAVDVDLVATLYREEWNTTLAHENGRYRYKSTRKLEPVGTATVVRAAAGVGTVALTPPAGGRYVLAVADPAGAEASVAFDAIDGAWADNVSRADPEKLELTLLPPTPRLPLADVLSALRAGDLAAVGRLAQDVAAAIGADKEDAEPRYRVGDRARVLVRSPFAGRLLLCVETDGLVSRQVVEMPASQMVVPIEVTAACRPNGYVTATVVRAVDPNAKWRAHRAAGAVRLTVDPGDRSLVVKVDAPAEILPNTTLSAVVRVTDDQDRPAAGAAVTVAAVDEGILSLTRFQTPDPLKFFTASRALGVSSADLYSLLMPEVAKPEKAVGGDIDAAPGGARHLNPVVAKRVTSVALFTGVLRADEDGLVHVELPVGAFAGQLRLMAVAYTGERPDGGSRFGSGDARSFVRSPVLVQSSWPRFAAPGDAFVAPVTVFNNTDADRTVRVRLTLDAADGPPPLTLAGGATTRDLPPVLVKAKSQTTLNLDLSAGQSAGVARVRLTADSDGQPAFVESLELPVRPAAPMLTDGGYAEAKPGAPAVLTVPADVLPGTRQLQVRVTSWPSLGVPRGLQQLDRYPYGCAEQTTSTAFPLVYLGEVGEAVAPGMFDRDRIAAKVQAGVLRLMGMQTADGGLAMWPGGRESWPWASVYAAHFLLEAKAAGHAVPEDFESRLLGYCRALLERSSDSTDTVEVQAYACYALSTAGKPPRATMNRLTELLGQKRAADDPDWRRLQASTARSNLAMAWVAAGRLDLAGTTLPRLLPEGGATGRQLGGNVGSPTRDRAVLLTALLLVDPNRPEIAGLAKELADAGAKGRWMTTQETSFALAALGRYLKAVGKSPAYDSAELWADGQKVASAEGGKPLAWDLPATAAAPTRLEVRVAGQPDGRAFAAWVQNGVPTKPPAAADAGMTIRRRYLDRDGAPADVANLASGDLVQVELTLSSANALENVVIEDLLPAGLEVENARLAGGAAAVRAVAGRRANRLNDTPADPIAPAMAAVPALPAGHLEVRDDRVVVMAHLPSGGAGRFTYLARAIAPGTFVVPPVRAECMYDAGICSVWGGGGQMKVSAQRRANPGVAGAE